jgi:sigma-E factor negative regulatory protein RseB
MSVRVPRPALVVVAVAALAGLAPMADLGPRAGAGQPDPAEQLLIDARDAAAEHDFTAVLQVTWSDGGRERSHEVPVRSTNGVLALGDREEVVIDGSSRFLHATEGWLAVWRASTQSDVPSPSQKWQLTLDDGPVIAGRPTRQVDAADRDGGRVRERFYFDESTGMLLRREQLDSRGDTVRAVGFMSLGEGPSAFVGAVPAEAPRAPRGAAARQPQSVESVGAPFRAPSTAGNGFRLAGRYRDADGTVQLFYSDGLFGVSVFEQEGELDSGTLPAGGEAHSVAGHDGRRYRTPAGVVTIWESDEVVYTAVADAPDDQVDELLDDFAPDDSPGAVERVTTFVLGPFSW